MTSAACRIERDEPSALHSHRAGEGDDVVDGGTETEREVRIASGQDRRPVDNPDCGDVWRRDDRDRRARHRGKEGRVKFRGVRRAGPFAADGGAAASRLRLEDAPAEHSRGQRRADRDLVAHVRGHRPLNGAERPVSVAALAAAAETTARPISNRVGLEVRRSHANRRSLRDDGTGVDNRDAAATRSRSRSGSTLVIEIPPVERATGQDRDSRAFEPPAPNTPATPRSPRIRSPLNDPSPDRLTLIRRQLTEQLEHPPRVRQRLNPLDRLVI